MSRERMNLIFELQKQLFEKQGCGWFQIVSGSMRPLISVSDRIFVKKVNTSELRAGDIILFTGKNIYITHRIVKIVQNNGKTMFLQKGDASVHAGMIRPEAVVGKVVAIKKGGRVFELSEEWVWLLNGLLGLRNRLFFRIEAHLFTFRMKERVRWWAWLLKWPYRMVTKPFRCFSSLVMHFVFVREGGRGKLEVRRQK